jgi:hypothetical protein
MRRTALTLCVLTAGVLVTLAQDAPARWGTGQGEPPGWNDEQVCRNGVAWLYATVGPPYIKTDPATGQPVPDPDGSGPPRTQHLYDAVATPFTGGDPDPNPSPVLSRKTLAVPYHPIWVDPDVVGIHGSDWGPGNRPGLFDFSAHFVLQFNALQPASGQVRVQWRFTPNGAYSAQGEDYPEWPVDDCYLIDVEPGKFPNRVAYRVPRDQIAVAVLTTPGLDAARIEESSVRLGTRGETAKPRYSKDTDIDDDGDRDFVARFLSSQTGIRCASTSVRLTARLAGGRSITGSDSVEPVGC